MSTQAELRRQYEAEYAAFEAGAYTERVHDWLATSWQGDALQVGLAQPSDGDPERVLTYASCMSHPTQNGIVLLL